MSRPYILSAVGTVFGVVLVIYLFGYSTLVSRTYTGVTDVLAEVIASSTPQKPVLDKVAYDKKMASVANCPTVTIKVAATSSTASAGSPASLTGSAGSTSTAPATTLISTTSPSCLWPAKTVYPLPGALLPFNRIVAYYGNFYSTGMGVLGQYPEDVMIQKLQAAVAQWEAADPSTPVIPAIDYIDVTAQASAGKDGKYRARMPDSQIDKAITIANKVHGIVILDIQVGLSTLPQELPLLIDYLKMPTVHLAIDPEFAMHGGAKPGTVIGSFDATDINYAINYLTKLVQENNLPPKILIVHRFTNPMVTNYKNIKPTPEVQVVMDMDGWGTPERKIGTYNTFISPQPVQFTGFKLFYKNDLKAPSKRLLSTSDVLKLTPQPLFIQYQ